MLTFIHSCFRVPQSTILCAICLGLGGEPRLLGRASDVETFIANGEDEGSIEIELVNTEGGANPVIRRDLSHGKPKSKFFWNDQPVTAKSVRETCLEKYHITVDNLCTFLPQDRVGNFSGLNAQELLVETEKSLNPQLYETHLDLIQEQEQMKGGAHQKETLEHRLAQLQQEARRLESAKELLEERELAEKQSALLQKKMLWLHFDDLVAQTNQKKAAKTELKQRLQELKTELRPLEENTKSRKFV